MSMLLSIVLGTLLSEDLTCIAVGLAIREGQLSWAIGLTGCYVGILLGDFGLWLLGRFVGPPLLRQAWTQRLLPARGVERLGHWFDRRGWAAVFLARFVPGARFPIYVAAGILGRSAVRFLLFAALAGLVWTPVLIGGVWWLGKPLVDLLERFFDSAWIAIPLAAALLWLLLRGLLLLATPIGQARLFARVSLLWRWEFWPMWLFYLPLVPWIALLAVRYGWRSITVANPGMPHSGLVGESKSAILATLPAAWTVPSRLLPPAPLPERLALLDALLTDAAWSYPLVLKPDAGERGAGVRLIPDRVAAEEYLAAVRVPVLAQVHDPGPEEAGVFYYRFPDWSQGRIYSITDKVFPVLVGDGVHTLEELIWRHPRYRMQARVFLQRHREETGRVLAAGESLPLARAGNHCQGTMFRDGGGMITPALAARIDEIARAVPGFYFGRFDVRYSDRASFTAGTDLRIVELNGALSESTNLYDPALRLWQAYGILAGQWRLLFAIGAANRRAGHRVSGLRALWATVRQYYREQRVALRSS